MVTHVHYHNKTTLLLFPCWSVNIGILPCAVGPLGACGVIDGKGYNLGYVQSNPQVAESGSISIVYHNGDRCGSTSRYSTRIIFQCDDNPVSIRRPQAQFLH